MKILLVAFLVTIIIQSTFKLKYTGHCRGWSDNLARGSYDSPLQFLWILAKDSSWAEMQIFRKDHSDDTITFSHLRNRKWKLLRYLNEKADFSFADVDIDQSNDSIKIGLGFGYTGISYYARRDSE